jgi:lipopolysaccharide/colanic/teichoic acid biosynthesis glycosyltransferase
MSASLSSRKVPVVKRLFDLLLVVPGLVLVSPILGAVVLAIWLSDGRPILFRQPRPGYKGKIFKNFKFRTMRNLAGSDGRHLPDSKRVTRLGRFLRTTSLDELPELFNVLRGEMSLVGPRPLLVVYLQRYSSEQARRHDTLPGMTGWAQINGRNAISWEDKFRLDVWYVDHWSVGLDIKILALTLLKVIRREGITPAGQENVQEFMGTKD